MGGKISDLRRKISRTVVIWALFVSRWPIGRMFLRKILLFYIFSDLQVTFSGFFVNHFTNGLQNCFFQAKRNISIRKNILIKDFFHHFRTMREFFLNFRWNIWGMVVKTTVFVFKRALWESLSIFQDFSYVFCDFEWYSSRTLAKSFSSIAQTAF